VAIEQHGKPVG